MQRSNSDSGFFCKAVCKIAVHWKDKFASPFATHISNFFTFCYRPMTKPEKINCVKENNGVLSISFWRRGGVEVNTSSL